MKKGQITIFIILAIIVLIVVALILLLKNPYDIKPEHPNHDGRAAIERSVEECIKLTTTEGITVIGDRGGYYKLPAKAAIDPVSASPYYLDRGVITMPTVATIERQLAQYVDEKLEFCIQDLLQNHPPLSAKGPVNSTVTFTDSGLEVKVSYPLELVEGDSVQHLKKFSVYLDSVRMGQIYTAVSDYVEEQAQYPSLVCTSCMAAVGEQYNLSFVAEINNRTAVLSALDDQSLIDGYPYIFVFSIRFADFACNSLPENADTTFHIDCLEVS